MEETATFASMKDLTIKKVETKRTMNDFVRFPEIIYKDCLYYVPDLEMDIRNMFNPKKNAGLECSEIQAFVAYDSRKFLVGRIAGIINHRANKKWKTHNVRFGLFDFVDDLEVSSALLKSLKWKPEPMADLLLIAVRPDYQMLGVNAIFFEDLIPIYNKHGIQWAETGSQLEDNVRELSQWKPLNPAFIKRRRCYKKEL